MLLYFKNNFENFNLKICEHFNFKKEYNILQIEYLNNNKILFQI